MSAGNPAYSPLPQSNSDSDSSEEELHVSQGNRVVNRNVKVQNSKGEKPCVEQKNNINYNLLDNDGDVGVVLNKFQSGPEEVSILKPDGGLEIFSTPRKICFVFSLLLCVFTTVAFVWILPCNVEPCLSASDERTLAWEKNLPNLEIYGPISLVTDQEEEENILFLTRSFSDSKKNFSENGLTCLKGKDGSFIWDLKLDGEPIDADCKLVDINADGINDCLIFGINFLKAVDSISGLELWDIQKSNEEKRLQFMDFPLVILDVDGDKVKDFLLPCSFSTDDMENHVDFQNYLVIISGISGRIINNPEHIQSCSSVHNLKFANSSVLSFTCFNSNVEEFHRISFSSLYLSLKNKARGRLNFDKMDMLLQHKGHPDAVVTNGFRLILKNRGHWPGTCDFEVVVRDEHKNPKNKTIYHFKRTNALAMTPVILKRKKETSFILKYWEWNSKVKNSGFQNNTKFTAQKAIIKTMKTLNKRSKHIHHLLNSSKILDKAMLLESEWESQRSKRTAVKVPINSYRKNVKKPGILNLQMITEQIVKININQSQVFTSKIMKDDIFQICNKPQKCKPDGNQQKHSVLVAPLKKNGKEMLITYTSTYTQKKKEAGSESNLWQLQSNIKILNI